MPVRALRTLAIEPNLPGKLQGLWPLARNLWWTWNTSAPQIFRDLGPDTWETTGHNPVRLLQLLSDERAAELQDVPAFVDRVDRVCADFEEYMSPVTDKAADTALGTVAYFSMEFALTESFPTYSGGLGVLAGDHLKSSSDLRLPLVGVGLFYSEGYFHQQLNSEGWQEESYRPVDPLEHPVHKMTDRSDQPIRVEVPIGERTVIAQVWRADVGHVPLYLLDTNIEENTSDDRRITARLYGGDVETRIQQEMILGIGGIRALTALGVVPAVCHMNEGHSAFLGLERIWELRQACGADWEEARIAAAAGTVFTTHTAVAAGIDLFPASLVRSQMGTYLSNTGVREEDLLALGRLNPRDDAEPLSMAVLGLRLSERRNGVSRLHGQVSRKLWARTWPSQPEELVPIGSITNGVHLPSWTAHEMATLFDRSLGPSWRSNLATDWQAIHALADEELWRTRNELRRGLLADSRVQASRMNARRTHADSPGALFRDDVLTIGFARRFNSYKRATLLFRDPLRLAGILNDPERPVQFLFAGKAHPRDEAGKQLLQEVFRFTQQHRLSARVHVLEDYDLAAARTLVQGCDVWLNTPRRPLEASGTSGMKSVANGGLHLSIRDGWWAEGFREPFGWAIGGLAGEGDSDAQDNRDAAALYNILEEEVVPLFYRRDARGIPVEWVERMKGSIASYAPVFNTGRMVMDYAQTAYLPASRQWKRMTEDGLERARSAKTWLNSTTEHFESVKILSVEEDSRAEEGSHMGIVVVVQTDPHMVHDLRVEALFGRAGLDDDLSSLRTIHLVYAGPQGEGTHLFRGEFNLPAGRAGYTVRVTAENQDLGIVAEQLASWA